jgi:hypothetical protein
MVDSGDDARAVLERMRQAAIDQSADAMAQLYSTDVVHEFLAALDAMGLS